MNDNTQISDIQAAIAAGKALGCQQIDIAGTPLRIEQRVKHSNVASFVAYHNKFADENSVIFINNTNNSFTSILDYHNKDHANWTEHTSTFSLVKTPEWSAWEKSNGVKMGQEEFGLFIENNLEEIIEPSGAEMLEIATTIQSQKDVKFSSGLRLDNGQVQLTYHEQIDGTAGVKGQFKIPQTFKIGLRLYEGGDAYEMRARFRYRIKDGALALWYELIRPHKTIEANLDDTEQYICEKIVMGNIYHAT